MKNVKEMTEQEFQAAFKFDRQLAQQVMLNTRCSPLPDRPMHPNAKMSGEQHLDTATYYALQDYFRNHDSKLRELRESQGYKSAYDICVSGEIDNGV